MKRNGDFVICVGNKVYSTSLELRKIYQVRSNRPALRLHQIRVIDESGEDYLYPEEFFVPVKLPQVVEQVIRRTSAYVSCRRLKLDHGVERKENPHPNVVQAVTSEWGILLSCSPLVSMLSYSLVQTAFVCV
jgi:hypothetical protein